MHGPEKPVVINAQWVKKVQKIARLKSMEETYDFFIRNKKRAFDDDQWSKIVKVLDGLTQQEKADADHN